MARSPAVELETMNEFAIDAECGLLSTGGGECPSKIKY